MTASNEMCIMLDIIASIQILHFYTHINIYIFIFCIYFEQKINAILSYHENAYQICIPYRYVCECGVCLYTCLLLKSTNVLHDRLPAEIAKAISAKRYP